MQTSKFAAIIIAILLISACTASKRSTKTTAVSPVAKAPTTSAEVKPPTPPIPPTPPTLSQVNPPASPFTSALMTKPLDGIYAPRKEELAAIQRQFPTVTMEKLAEGYDIYTKGACTNCHKPQAIYQFSESEWKPIMVDMAQKARISEAQEEAVYQYVLSIKATQNK